MTVHWRMRAARAGIGVLAVAVLVHVAVLIPRIAPLAGTLPERVRAAVWAVVLTVVTAAAACVLALVLLFRAGERPGVPVLASFLCFLAAFWGSLLRFLMVTVEADSLNASLTFGGLTGFLATTALLASVASFVHLSSTFPRLLVASDLGPARRLRWLRRARVALLRPAVLWSWVVVLVLVQWFGGRVIHWLVPGSTQPAPGPMPAVGVVNVVLSILIMVVAPLVGIGLGVRNLRAGYRRADAADRRPVLWLVAGYTTAAWMVLVPIVMALLVVVLGVDSPDLLGLVWAVLLVTAPTVVVVTTAIAVFFAGAFDPGLILRRSTIWGFAGAVGLLMFAGLENALSDWVEARLALPGMVGALAAGGLAAGVMVPVRVLMSRIAGLGAAHDAR